MSLRFTGMALASAIVIAFGNISTAEAQLLGSRPLSVPITGSVTGGGSFVGTLNIQRFVTSGSATVAVAAIAGAVVDAPGVGNRTGVHANVTLPVSVAAAVAAAYRPRGSALDGPGFLLVRQCGGAIDVSIGGSTVNVMGVAVMLDPAVLHVDAGSGGLIGSLVCSLLSTLGVGGSLTGLLNQLLLQILPLVGGLGGGLLL